MPSPGAQPESSGFKDLPVKHRATRLRLGIEDTPVSVSQEKKKKQRRRLGLGLGQRCPLPRLRANSPARPTAPPLSVPSSALQRHCIISIDIVLSTSTSSTARAPKTPYTHTHWPWPVTSSYLFISRPPRTFKLHTRLRTTVDGRRTTGARSLVPGSRNA